MAFLISKRTGLRPRRIALLAVGMLAAAIAVGQGTRPAALTPDTDAGYVPALTFDVASVRQSPPADTVIVVGSFTAHTSSMKAMNIGIENLIYMAYGSDRYYRVVGLPGALHSVVFDIQAKSDSAADEKIAHLTNEQAKLEQQHMLQVLLAERFNLKVHWETKEGDVYNLAAKKSSKLRESNGGPPSAEERKIFGDRPVPALYQSGNSRDGFAVNCRGCTIAMIVRMLAGPFGRPVIDKTGLTGKYDFTVHYLGTLESLKEASDISPLPPLYTAIQDQLGLKLESAKGPISILVIDHAEMPSQN